MIRWSKLTVSRKRWGYISCGLTLMLPVACARVDSQYPVGANVNQVQSVSLKTLLPDQDCSSCATPSSAGICPDRPVAFAAKVSGKAYEHRKFLYCRDDMHGACLGAIYNVTYRFSEVVPVWNSESFSRSTSFTALGSDEHRDFPPGGISVHDKTTYLIAGDVRQNRGGRSSLQFFVACRLDR